MNDFTKDELQIILLDMIFYSKNKKFKCLTEAHSHVECREKVQRLIDNYPKCDHRAGWRYYLDDGTPTDLPTDIYRCRHCDILFKFLYKDGACIGSKELE